jgi:hypothetical protein
VTTASISAKWRATTYSSRMPLPQHLAGVGDDLAVADGAHFIAHSALLRDEQLIHQVVVGSQRRRSLGDHSRSILSPRLTFVSE